MRMMRPPVREENVSLDTNERVINQTQQTNNFGELTVPEPKLDDILKDIKEAPITSCNTDSDVTPYNLGFTKELKIESSVTVTTKKGGFYKFSVMETRDTNADTNIEMAKKDMFDKLNASLDDQLMELKEAGII